MLEIIAQNTSDIKILNETNASQIEFCVDLNHDGLSPDIDLLKAAIKISKKPLRVMIRHHFNSFLVNDKQMKMALDYIDQTKHLSFEGYVWGAINKNKEVDFINLQKIINRIGNKNLTFHKAFDHVRNKHESLIKLMAISKIKYILTSGGVGNPLENISFFKKISNEHKFKILIGGGVNHEVIKELKKIGYDNFHVGKRVRNDNSYKKSINKNKINDFV